jgi:predicted 3-demethylubiquinone-9 3-methyltransferase (glyoxalase superfamily)
MSKVTSMLWFADRAEEAAKFYVSVIPNSKIQSVTTLPTGPAPGSSKPPKVIELSLSGSDYQILEAGKHDEFNDAMSMVVVCKDQAEVDKIWMGLLEGGGQEQQCGWLRDRYNVRWQVVPARMYELQKDKDPAKAGRAIDAMMKMVKLDIAALEKAAAG